MCKKFRKSVWNEALEFSQIEGLKICNASRSEGSIAHLQAPWVMYTWPEKPKIGRWASRRAQGDVEAVVAAPLVEPGGGPQDSAHFYQFYRSGQLPVLPNGSYVPVLSYQNWD